FSAWLGEWDQERDRLETQGTSRAQAELEAARGLLFLVNKVREQDGAVETMLREVLPVGFRGRGYGEGEIQRLIDANILRVARCLDAADLALLFRGLRPVEVPPIEKYVPGLGRFLDGLLPPPRWAAHAVTPRTTRKRDRKLDAFFVRGGKEIDLEPVEDGIAISAAPTGRGLRAPLRAELEREGLYRTVGLEHPGVEVYQLPRGRSFDSVVKQLVGREGVRYVNRLYRHDPARPDNVLVLTDRLFVRFRPDLSPAKIEAYAVKHGIHLVEPIEEMPGGFLALVKSSAMSTALEIANELVQDELVVFAEPDWVRALVHRGRRKGSLCEGDQWHLENTGQSKGTRGADAGVVRAWGLGARGKGVTIAILDDGVDIDHPQLDVQGKLVQGLDVRCRTPDPRPKYGHDHGTAVAGVALAARTKGRVQAPAGAAPGARLMAIRMMPEVTTESDFARAFRHARMYGADIVNCSWGIPGPRSVFDPIPTLVAHEIDLLATKGRGGLGAPVFFAAGNDRESVSTDGYASYPNVIAVAASDHHDQRADYSNFGPEVWVCAPSEPGGIVTLAPDAGHIDDFGGTSAACPLVAGIAALIMEANPKLTWTEIKEILAGTADKIDAAGRAFVDCSGKSQSTRYDARGHSQAYGYGRVNAEKAVQEAKRRKPGRKP
ncbi:MAG TPA: S8 family serine peptidase, partial [Candidatus Nanopelagicales bacterium]|nr:S8 family serine peptidase [Candidatus Nanopelagicales bacterium]